MFISLIWFHFFFCLFFYSQYDRRDIKILTKRLILIMPTASNTYYSESDLILTICSLVCHFNVWADIISLYRFFFTYFSKFQWWLFGYQISIVFLLTVIHTVRLMFLSHVTLDWIPKVSWYSPESKLSGCWEQMK